MGIEEQYYKTHKFSVEKLSNGTYKVIRDDYQGGSLVGQYEYSYTIDNSGEEDPISDDIGIYQSLHPYTYLTDTSVQDAPLDMSSGYGLKQAFMNCSALSSVNLSTDVIISSSGALENSYAFSGCTSLVSVDLGDIMLGKNMSSTLSVTPSFLCMFDGCSNLTNISGSIYFTSVTPALLAHMFRGCTKLDCSNLKIYNGFTDSIYDLFQKYTGNRLEIDGETYTYSYEALGLTKAQLHQATIYDENGNIITDFEVFS